MGRDTGIANRLRSMGLRVVEVDGWQTRGVTDFAPGGSVNHHTAGPSTGATPSLNTCINGRPDLPGPLCHVMQSREPSDDIAYVIAAGKANHAGEGGWRGLVGNASVYGLEIEHDGISALPQRRIDTAAAIHAAMFPGDPAMVCQHREWASAGRKIDAATNVDGDEFRQRVGDADVPTMDQIIKGLNDAAKAGKLDPYFHRARQIIEAGDLHDLALPILNDHAEAGKNDPQYRRIRQIIETGDLETIAREVHAIAVELGAGTVADDPARDGG